MNRLHILMVALFAVALGAGIVVGMGISRPPAPRDMQSWLVAEMQLSPSQSEQMKSIWSEIVNDAEQRDPTARKQYQKERDDALQALLSPEQKASYEKILAHYKQQIADMEKQRSAEYQAAVARTKQILNDHQRQVYEQLLKNGFKGRPRGRPDGGRGGPRRMHPEGGRGPRHGPESGPGVPAGSRPGTM